MKEIIAIFCALIISFFMFGIGAVYESHLIHEKLKSGLILKLDDSGEYYWIKK